MKQWPANISSSFTTLICVIKSTDLANRRQLGCWGSSIELDAFIHIKFWAKQRQFICSNELWNCAHRGRRLRAGRIGKRIFVYQTESRRMHSFNYICIQYTPAASVRWNVALIYFLFFLFFTVSLLPLCNFSRVFFSLCLLHSPPLTPPPLFAAFFLYYNSVSNPPPPPNPNTTHPPSAFSVWFGPQINRHPCFNKVNCDPPPQPPKAYWRNKRWEDERRWNEVWEAEGGGGGLSLLTWRNLMAA